MQIFQKPILKLPTNKKREMPEGLWQKCPDCGEVIHNLELVQNLKVCPKCDYHFTLSAKERIDNLIDPETFSEFDPNMLSVDVLRFKGVAAYGDRLKSYQEKTGLKDAVLTGFGQLEGKPVAVGGGYLTIDRPWPAMLRGIYGDPERYRDTYWSRFEGRYFAGDGAKIDEDGYIWLLGRVDDVMNVRMAVGAQYRMVTP